MILGLFVVIHTTGFSQNQAQDNSLFLTPATDSIKATVVEVYSLKSNRTFQLVEGRNVWIHCQNNKGKIKTKRSRITDVTRNRITFMPYDDSFKEVTYAISDIRFLGFTSAGRIVMASVSNILIIGAVTTLYLIVAIGDLLTGGGGGTNPSFDWVPFVPFRKDITFMGSAAGLGKWHIRVIEIP